MAKSGKSKNIEVFGVGDAVYYIKELLEENDSLNDLWMRGEVTNLSPSNSGHYYFTLKDGAGQLRCALFRNVAIRQKYRPRNGASYILHGKVSVYEARGELQFIVDLVQPDGVGQLALEYELLKQRLEEEGLFALERKRPLPPRPKVIGVVTSPNAAAFQDILKVLGRRYPLAQVLLSPTLVQGETAPPQIVDALQLLNRRADVDVIIVARGGGSGEDLSAFNDERVVRAIFASRVPVVTGVGHETDTTLVDFVSDLRAPTPSAAAELVAPDLQELANELGTALYTLIENFETGLTEKQADIASLQRRLQLASPAAKLSEYRRQVEGLLSRSRLSLKHRLELQQASVKALEGQLVVMNPRQILSRGYALVTRTADGQPISRTAQVQPGDSLTVQVQDGTIETEVK